MKTKEVKILKRYNTTEFNGNNIQSKNRLKRVNS